MSVRAKFKCEVVKDCPGGKTIELRAVYDSDPNSENGRFFKYTPGGSIVLSIVNPVAAEQFVEGQEYYLDFTPAS